MSKRMCFETINGHELVYWSGIIARYEVEAEVPAAKRYTFWNPDKSMYQYTGQPGGVGALRAQYDRAVRFLAKKPIEREG